MTAQRKYDVIECDVMLLGWSETHNGGEKVTFQLEPGQIHFFKDKTLKKGKVAGQLFKMVLVEVDGNGEPLPAEKGGVMTNAESAAPLEKAKSRAKFPDGLCGLAVKWCADSDFHAWLRGAHERATEVVYMNVGGSMPAIEFARLVVLYICNIASRKELDTNADAAETFKSKILTPYAAHRKALGLDERGP